ncbi:MAG: hypothetical protein H9893_08545 [Candidatus Niameybacter stercoravium]|nr:hypothetical protein [Candidatus Niameybacter stercoravium]
MLFKNKIKKQIELQINDLKLYLENNYKDLAIQARKDAIALVEQSYKNKQINEKTYLKYQKQLGEYTEQMKDYNHQQFYRS